jgi:apolipoprotein N-acyltransferase
MFDPNAPRSRVFLPAILSGLLLYLCYFPVDAGYLGWIALIPLLSLVRANVRPRRIYLATFVGGLVCYVPVISWIRVAHPAMYASWLFLAFVCSLFLVMMMWLIRRLDRVGLPLWLAAPVGFVSVEYFRSHFPTGYTWLESVGLRHPIGFGWYMLGHTQHDWISLIQISDLTGAYGVTVVVVVVNAAIWSALEANAAVRRWLVLSSPAPIASMRPSLIAAGLLIGSVFYGLMRLSDETTVDGPEVALVQGNLPQDAKNEHGDKMEGHFGQLALQAARPPAGVRKPDLVIWPETSFVHPFFNKSPDVSLDQLSRDFRLGHNISRIALEDAALQWRTPTLLGLTTFQWEADNREWRYNSALLVNARGKPLARYDKIHLVPFGEYVPLEKQMPFLKAFTPYEGDYSCKPGEEWTRFPLDTRGGMYHFGCLICYEDTDATLARQYVRPGAEGVDFIVNISNDGWFDGTAEHEQHLAICRFRAVETRRSIVRAVNMGISAVIDPDGRVIALPGDSWATSKKVEGVVRAMVPIDTRTTLYARFGDWLPLLGWAIVFGGFVRGFVRRRRAA